MKLRANLRIRAVSPKALLFAQSFIKSYCLRKASTRFVGYIGPLEALLFAYVRMPIFSRRSSIVIQELSCVSPMSRKPYGSSQPCRGKIGTYANSKALGEPAHPGPRIRPCNLARRFTGCCHKQWALIKLKEDKIAIL